MVSMSDETEASEKLSSRTTPWLGSSKPSSSFPTRTWITSSMEPRSVYASLVMLRSTVSPVAKAAAMMTVLSMRPMTMRDVWALRRGMLRTPSLNMTRLRRATRAMLGGGRGGCLGGAGEAGLPAGRQGAAALRRRLVDDLAVQHVDDAERLLGDVEVMRDDDECLAVRLVDAFVGGPGRVGARPGEVRRGPV